MSSSAVSEGHRGHAPVATPAPASAPRPGPGPARPVLPLLGHVDADCAALVQAMRRAGFQPHLCASAWQLAGIAQAEGAALVVVQASAVKTSPRRLLETLHLLAPLRVVLAGPEPGSLEHALALDLGFDEVWPQSLRGVLLETTLARAWTAAPPPGTPTFAASAESRRPPLAVNLTNNSCTVAGCVVHLPRDCARLLHSLLLAYPAAMPRAMLADAMGLAVNDELPLGRRIDMTASRLRHKLHEAGQPQLRVSPTRGVGYRLEVRDDADT